MKNKRMYFLSAIAAVVVAFISISCVNNSTSNAGSGSEQPIASFKNISVGGCWDIFVSNAPTTTIKMEGAQEDIDKIEVEVKDETLHINLKKEFDNCGSNVKIYVSATQLENISMAGSGLIKLDGKFTNSTSMNFSIAGSGNIEGEVSSPDIDADIAGSGEIILSGDTKQLDVDIAGSGNFSGQSFSADYVDADIAGSGDVYINAVSKLTVEIAGSGNVYYTGDPDIKRKIAGSGDLIKN